MDIATAFAIFAASFSETPSRRLISTRHQAGPLPVFHSEYVWHGEPRITDDFFIHGYAPEQSLAEVRAYGPVPHHYLLVIDDQPSTLAAYQAAGYQLAILEYLMARPLDALPPLDERFPVKRVQTADEAARVNAGDAEHEPWVRPINLETPTMQHYYLAQDGLTAARAANMQIDADCSYVTHVFTHPDYRRRGLSRAVMLRLLHDCAARGETASVLVASEQGDLLYRRLGYTRLAPMLVLEPSNSTKE